MQKQKMRFKINNISFRIAKIFSYGMAYEAFCKGYINPEELMGKEIHIPNEYGYERERTIVEVANKCMGLDFFGKHVKRTYITAIDSGNEGRQLYYYWQRDWRGFDGSEMWSLDYKILEYLIPRLEHFSKYCCQKWPIFKNGHVEYVNGKVFVDEIIKGFKLWQEDRINYTTYEKQCIHRSFNLFKEHFGDLWC